MIHLIKFVFLPWESNSVMAGDPVKTNAFQIELNLSISFLGQDPGIMENCVKNQGERKNELHRAMCPKKKKVGGGKLGDSVLCHFTWEHSFLHFSKVRK